MPLVWIQGLAAYFCYLCHFQAGFCRCVYVHTMYSCRSLCTFGLLRLEKCVWALEFGETLKYYVIHCIFSIWNILYPVQTDVCNYISCCGITINKKYKPSDIIFGVLFPLYFLIARSCLVQLPEMTPGKKNQQVACSSSSRDIFPIALIES